MHDCRSTSFFCQTGPPKAKWVTAVQVTDTLSGQLLKAYSAGSCQSICVWPFRLQHHSVKTGIMLHSVQLYGVT